MPSGTYNPLTKPDFTTLKSATNGYPAIDLILFSNPALTPSVLESQATCIFLLPSTLAEIQSRSSEETKSAIADAPA